MPEPTQSTFDTPEVPDIVERPRLIRQLDAADGRRFSLIVAQAAQGKTTLAASYLLATGQPGAWVHLEKTDADAARFYELAVNGLQQAFPGQDLSRFLKMPTVSLGAGDERSRCRDRLLHLLGTVSRPVMLVLDGLENLPHPSSALALIEDLLHCAPPLIRVMLITREMPPFRLQRLKMNRDLLLLSNEDLAFTLEEIDAFFRLRNSALLTPEQIERIRKTTGGWAGGLVLVSEGLKKVDETDRTAWIDTRLPELLKGEVIPYFSEEVLADQPEEVRSLLIVSSLLEVVDPSVLSKLARAPDAEAVFQDLVRRNLFVHRINDHRKGVLFRHNRLFRDFLQSLFRQRTSKPEKIELLARAGELYWKAGEPEKAVDFFLRAGRTERAVDGIMHTAMDLLVRGRFADLARWIDALPKRRVTADPWLRLYRTLTRRISGGKRTMEELAEVQAQFSDRSDVRGRMLSLAYLIEAGVFLGTDPSVLGRWIEEGEALIRTWSEKPLYAYAKTQLWLQIGFGQIAGPGDLQKGLSACQNAYLLALKIGDGALQANATIVSVLGLAVAGNFAEADRALARIGQLAETAAYPEYRVLQSIVGIRLAMNRGDFDRAHTSLERSRDDIETFGLLFVYPAFVETTGKLALYRGEYSEAERCSRHLSDVAVLAGNPYYHALSLQLAAMIRYHTGAFHPASRMIGQALDTLPDTGGASIHRFRFKLLQGLIALHLDEPEQALSALLDALSRLSEASSPLTFAETHLALGLVYADSGETGPAEEHLNIGFSTAAEKEYVHFLVMRPADAARACLLFAGRQDRVHRYAADLLASRLSGLPGVEVDALLKQNCADDDRPPISVRRALYRSRLPKIHIITLGRFDVLRDRQKPIEEKQWAGARPKLLLKSIVVHGCRDIPKDILIEDLWPESGAAAAAQNFKVTLHRLRKVLEPELNREIGSAYVHLKDNLVSLDQELCRTDVETFLSLVKEIRRQWGRTPSETLLARCVEGTALYGGDFLPEEPYLPWAEMKRSVLRDHYLEILSKLVDLYRDQGRFDHAIDCCKKILQSDPSSDLACQHLMALLHRQGMRAAALKAYEAFRSHLISDIGVEPDSETTSIYLKIKQNR
jgi:ATP/maltotriose-dependent transcriptional regulator MalT/DNA-binding SARP family transcriptional activator